MSENVPVRLADLLLDERNARLPEVQEGQPATYLALARLNPRYVLELASDIVEYGLDPLSLPAVVATGDRRRRYLVLEGNRRVLALKALETPAIIAPALDTAQQRKLAALSTKFHADPIDEVVCVLFEDEETARHWIFLRHTGLNDGAGVAPWDTDNQDAYKARHGAPRSSTGQVLDFLRKAGAELDTAADVGGITTTLTRLLSTPDVREAIGIEVHKNVVTSWYPGEELLKGLQYIADELRSGRTKVPDVYHADQRREFAKNLPRTARPTKATKLAAATALDDLTIKRPRRRKGGTPSAPPMPPPTPPPPPPRREAQTAIVPASCTISPDHPRLVDLFTELSTLEVDRFPNAGALLLRTFVELSIDRYLERHSLMANDQERRNAKLGNKMIVAADHLHGAGDIPAPLKDVIHNVAKGNGYLKPSVKTMHQYVHNHHAFPKGSELQTTWRELQPFLEKLWP